MPLQHAAPSPPQVLDSLHRLAKAQSRRPIDFLYGHAFHHRLPKRVMSGELENAGKRGPGGKEKEWTDCVADDLRLFGVTGDWKTAALDPGAWYNTVQEGGCRFMAAWVREEENASNQRQKKRDAEEADKVEVAPGVTVASLRRFRTALIGPTQGLPKRRRLCH